MAGNGLLDISAGSSVASGLSWINLRWLERNFSVHTNPSGGAGDASDSNLLYYLYGVERVGCARKPGRRPRVWEVAAVVVVGRDSKLAVAADGQPSW